jgi:hypothetical protein
VPHQTRAASYWAQTETGFCKKLITTLGASPALPADAAANDMTLVEKLKTAADMVAALPN